jgi:ABC-type transport system involved in multi-copper enzyme maturation permease subunit
LGSDSRRGAIVSVLVAVAVFAGLAFFLRSSFLEGAEEGVRVSMQDAPMVACLLAGFSWLVGIGVVKLSARRAVDDFVDAVREGPLWPIFVITVGMASLGVIGYFFATTPRSILNSLTRVPVAGTQIRTYVIPAPPAEVLDDPAKDPPQYPVDISFQTKELKSLQFRADQRLSIDVKETGDVDLNPLFRVNSGELTEWHHTGQITIPSDAGEVRQFFVRNYGQVDAELTVRVVTAPEHPEVSTALITAASVMGVFLLYLLQRSALPRLSAVALATYKSEIAQPLFRIVMAIGLFAIVAFIWIPYNTLGEDIKVLKDTGMTLIMILAILQAIWAASTSVADEIEGRTALTVLSKPIGRSSFICGKYLGIFWTVAVIFIILSVALMFAVSYKPIYDNREGSYKPIYEDRLGSTDEIIWQQCHYEMAGVVPGLVLAFLETIVLAALSVAISTRLPMLANFIICFSIYVLGHLTPLIVQSSVGKFAPVRFVAELLSTVLPILDHFNIQAAVSTGATVPYDYLGWTLLYSLLYGVMALLLALVLFEDRDLA